MSLIYTSVESVLVGSKLAVHLMSCGKKKQVGVTLALEIHKESTSFALCQT